VQIIKKAIINNDEIGQTLLRLYEKTETPYMQPNIENKSHLIIHVFFEDTLDNIIKDLKSELSGKDGMLWFNLSDDFTMEELIAVKEEFIELKKEELYFVEYNKHKEQEN